MTPHRLARLLGRRGGLARGRRLSATEKTRIASLGGRARAQSLLAAGRIADNFRYVATVGALQGAARVKQERACTRKLPGLYPTRS
jgi:hypothetical protein